MLKALRDNRDVADGLKQRVHTGIAEAERRDAPIAENEGLLELLEPRMLQATGVI